MHARVISSDPISEASNREEQCLLVSKKTLRLARIEVHYGAFAFKIRCWIDQGNEIFDLEVMYQIRPAFQALSRFRSLRHYLAIHKLYTDTRAHGRARDEQMCGTSCPRARFAGGWATIGAKVEGRSYCCSRAPPVFTSFRVRTGCGEASESVTGSGIHE